MLSRSSVLAGFCVVLLLLGIIKLGTPEGVGSFRSRSEARLPGVRCGAFFL